MKGWHIVLLAGMTVFAGGCATKYVAMDDTYEYRKGPSLAGLDCQFVLGDITDARKDKDSLGRLGNSFVNDSPNEAARGTGVNNGSETLEWLSHGLHSAGYLDAVDASKRKVVQVNIILRLAYIHPSLAAKASNIVLDVVFNDDPNPVIIRGSSAGVNWADGAGEIKASFNRSLDDALKQLNNLAIYKCGTTGGSG